MASPLFSAPTLTFKDSSAVKVALRDAEMAMQPKPPAAASLPLPGGRLSGERLQAPPAGAAGEAPMLVQSPPRAAHAPPAAANGEHRAAERQQKQQLPAGPSQVLVDTEGEQLPAAGAVAGFHHANGSGSALAASAAGGNSGLSKLQSPLPSSAKADFDKEDVGGLLITLGVVLGGGLVFGLLIWLIMRRMAQRRAEGDAPPAKADYLPLASAEAAPEAAAGAKEVEDLKEEVGELARRLARAEDNGLVLGRRVEYLAGELLEVRSDANLALRRSDRGGWTSSRDSGSARGSIGGGLRSARPEFASGSYNFVQTPK